MLDAERLERAQRAARLPGERLSDLLLRERLVPPGELVRLLDRLRAASFPCVACGRAPSWADLGALPGFLCPGCGRSLGLPPELAGSSSPLVRSDTGSGPMAPVLPEPPCRLGGWSLLSRLGRGSHGVVYLARRDGLERQFALKLLLPGHDDPDDLTRFRLEALAASRIQDPGVVGVVDVGQVGPFHYYAMEHCPGPTLKERLRDGPLPWREAARLVGQLSRTVAAAHRAGVLHRDLKPANVILDPVLGRPRLTDFGLARASDMERSLTRSGDLLGTPLYMAPEQLKGEKVRDPRADVYGLGGILYACLTGRPPHEAPTIVALTHKKLGADPVAPQALVADVPRALGGICLRALAREQRHRTASAEALAMELEALLAADEAGKGAAAPAPRGSRAALLGAAGLLLGLLAGAGAALSLRGPAPTDTAGPSAPAPPSEAPPSLPVPPPPASPSLEWGLCVYMPYDNKLSPMGEGILAELARGVSSTRVAVAAQADFAGPGGATRYVFRCDPRGQRAREVDRVPDGEESASPETLRRFLDWASEALPARRLALIILGPSRLLDETCLDQHPGLRFLPVPELAATVSLWRERVRARGGEVELLFLQQSSRGTLEILYALRGAARVLMASPTGLGAPNTYYAPVLERLSGAGEPMEGRELARAIAEADGANMFTCYAAVDGAALEELPTRLDAVLGGMLAGDPRLTLDPDELAGWVTHRAGEETYVDALGLLGSLRAGELDLRPSLDGFGAWVRGRLVVARRVSPQAPQAAGRWCGVSLYVPTSPSDLAGYDERWALLRAVRLREMWVRLRSP